MSVDYEEHTAEEHYNQFGLNPKTCNWKHISTGTFFHNKTTSCSASVIWLVLYCIVLLTILTYAVAAL